MINQHIRDEFIHVLAQEGVSLKDTWEILRLAATVQRLDTEFCNRLLTDQELNRRSHAVVKIAKICRENKATAIFDGDPRGACVKLKFPSGRTNDWAKEGYCVPTREF